MKTTQARHFFTGVLFMAVMMLFFTSSLMAEPTERPNFGFAEQITEGDGTPESPLIVVDLPNQLTWVALNHIMGHSTAGAAVDGRPVTENVYLPSVVEFRFETHSWLFDGFELRNGEPVRFQVNNGPIHLTLDGMTYANGTLSISPRFMGGHGGDFYNFYGFPQLTLAVGDHFEDGTVLNVAGPGTSTRRVTVADGVITIGVNQGTLRNPDTSITFTPALVTPPTGITDISGMMAAMIATLAGSVFLWAVVLRGKRQNSF